MARSGKKLDELAALLERTGGDAERLDAVKRAQHFRRSWLDLAEVLYRIRNSAAHERWGFDDFYRYCHEELTLKRATVDKLTASYGTIERHAPQVLSWDGVARTIPSYQAVDYFSRALGDTPANDPRAGREREPAEGAVDELTHAVFDEGQPVTELRRRFDPVFFPRPRGAEKLALIQKASAAARRLAELLPDIDGIADAQARRLETELGKLRSRLEELAEPLRAKVGAPRRLKPPRLGSS